MRAPLVIGIDVGGTKILSGLVDRDGNVVNSLRVVPAELGADAGLVGFEALDGLR